MAVYDLEEQERVDDLKAWWSRWGNVASWIAIGVAAVIVGVQGWRYWQSSRAEAASALYYAVATAGRTGEAAKAKDAMATLQDQYAGTGYAPRAALLYAKQLWSAGDKAGAKAQLQWVVDRASDDDLKQVARYRLAEALLDEKNVDEALKVLDAKHSPAYAGLYADLRGDALAAAGRNAEARAAYQVALAKIDAKTAYRNFVQVKLDALGGASADAAAAPAGAPAAAVAPPPAIAPAPAPAPAKKP
ncbi:MAG TPA: tetratricopeptide repeat protein [Casimicrobiaceae bacterium]|nr:tetratricopeptide repeat protein [Casimicrobiaceae bacterium]